MNSIKFSFDIGYASIGWSVISSRDSSMTVPLIVDCGVVLFPKDDCLASSRRSYRQLRRNIRASRQRQQRLQHYLEYKNIIPRGLDPTQGHPAPFFLAAQSLNKTKKLTAEEIWHVLRWYANNRGYDGNAQWSNQIDMEDTDRVKGAQTLMSSLSTNSMCETVCRHLQLDWNKDNFDFTVSTPAYKTLNVAFPRSVIVKEITTILENTREHLPNLTQEIIDIILTTRKLSTDQLQELQSNGVLHLPKRYQGGLLFGQLIPRFDNRIITRCPITWGQVYDQVKNEGKSDEDARQQADKLSKVPLANTPEFYQYRLARILANIRVDGIALPAEIRQELMAEAQKLGKLTKKTIDEIIHNHLGDNSISNISNMLTLHPDSEKALILDPALHLFSSNKILKELQETITPSIKKISLNILRKGKSLTVSEIRNLLVKHGYPVDQFNAKIELLKQAPVKTSKKIKEDDKDIENKKIALPAMSGRAPYARPILMKVVQEVLAGFDPSSPAKNDIHPHGENKLIDGILYSLLDPTSRVYQLQNERPLSDLTNNHLIRNRLLIFERLLKEMIHEFASAPETVIDTIIVEVGKEVSSFSGKTAKEISVELNERLRDFKAATKYLHDNNILNITGGLIRKCRIAQDMEFTCPFTGQKYDPAHLRTLEKEHLVPHSLRKTNSLASLVLTFPEVNKMKGQRTALEFIKACGGQSVPGMPNLHIMSEQRYQNFVAGLNTSKGHSDDRKRKEMRKKLMLVDKLALSKQSRGASIKEDEKVLKEFLPGAMTQSSHLMKLASQSIKSILPKTKIICIPGGVTAEIRKSWNVLGCLALACPDIIDEQTKTPFDKTTIREITHLHHALDAAVLGLTEFYLPCGNNGRVWQALLKRHHNVNDAALFQQIPGKRLYHLNQQTGDFLLQDLPPEVKNMLSKSLAHRRVMQHVSADQGGAKLEETIWRVVSIKGEGPNAEVTLTQNKLEINNEQQRIHTRKTTTEKASKLMGIYPTGDSKLQKLKGAMVIKVNYGIALDPEPTIIRHFNVPAQLAQIKQQCFNKPVRVLRNGTRILLPNYKDATKNGTWIVRSAKDGKQGYYLDLQRPELNISMQKKHSGNWRDVLVTSLLKNGLQILPNNYTAKQ
ncbi:MAG: HNH endonuclease domain-containing protein [Akkermansia sp.]